MDTLISLINKVISIFFFFSFLISFSQVDSTITLTFDFNEHQIKEKNNKVIVKHVGTTLTDDRFGNENSAISTHGHSTSYLNLGSSELFKVNTISISFWVNIDRRVYAGKGYDSNPLLTLNNSEGDDFTNAFAIAYECYNNRFAVNSTKDSTKEVTILSNLPVKFNRWYHLVFICNNDFLEFYVDGVLQSKAIKGFETKFLKTDSVIIGHSASLKNERFTQGMFDDIQVFQKALTDKEIQGLYNAPNPNRVKRLFTDSLKYIVIIGVLVIALIVILIRNKQKLKKQKEQLELSNRITELELKVVKAQMNPHFISNCLAAIQDLIYKNEIDKAGQYIAKFSYFLRQVLNYSNKNFITLSEEIEIIKLNIELEKLRFKNEFNFNLCITEDINADVLLVPALITQPFIENAIWHGLLQLKGKRNPELKITISVSNGFPVIEIEDNGVGRDLQKDKNEASKGTRLISDKIDSLNKLYKTLNYKLEIIDLFSPEKLQLGTKIRIHLDIVKE